MTIFKLPSDNEIMIERMFNTTRELLFRAYTDPQLIPMWWGPGIFNIVVDQMDVTPGGSWRYIQRSPGGCDYAFKGKYQEIEAPAKLVYTFEFEGQPGHLITERILFYQLDEQAKLTATSCFQSLEDRDSVLMGGIREGACETMNRLAQLVEKHS